MTDESRGVGGTVGPPWSVDVLADLHAGVLDEHEAARLWPRVQADPEARAIIEALEATTADLAALADEPAPPMPAEFAARIDQALAAEAASRQAASFPAAGSAPVPASPEPGVAPVVDLAAARRRRNKRLGWGAGILTAAAAAIVAIAVTVPGTTQETGTGVAAPAPAGPSVGGDGSGAEALLGGAMGVRDFGPLQDEQHLDACVGAAGLDPDVRPEGIRPVTVDGKPGVLVIYTTGQLAQFRLVAFGADCGPGHANVLFDKVVGKK
ncbi:hypothetical protein AB0K15_23215 [Amycolatopsis sp. NPDC049253]|uniref:hypothetical protein n=1 Tax=Amycolatopsis sp. NPDC049253 TaxID=3155274 RepID=UPI003431548D